jgi:hypothetical protein
MTGQHTPGPWKQHLINSGGHIIIMARNIEPYSEKPQGVDNEVCVLWGPQHEREANARLIEVAPELLEALQAMLLACPVREGGSTHAFARATVAKARGEQ